MNIILFSRILFFDTRISFPRTRQKLAQVNQAQCMHAPGTMHTAVMPLYL